jgi:Spx/MgsR family transcriptional regulator
MITIYGIRNCDTVRKARRWLDTQGVEYRFHDLRADGLSRPMLQDWISTLGWEQLLNRRGTTWRKLPESVRNDINRSGALELMLQNPAIIRRPLLEHTDGLYLGFSEARYTAIFRPQIPA